MKRGLTKQTQEDNSFYQHSDDLEEKQREFLFFFSSCFSFFCACSVALEIYWTLSSMSAKAVLLFREFWLILFDPTNAKVYFWQVEAFSLAIYKPAIITATMNELVKRKWMSQTLFPHQQRIRDDVHFTGEHLSPDPQSGRTISPLKSVLANASSNLPFNPVVHRRRPEKHVRFDVKLESLGEDLVPSSGQMSPSTMLKSSRRIVDPWRQGGHLYDAYLEYLQKRENCSTEETNLCRTSPASIEPDIEAPTYTHTFVIQTKSPDLAVDTIAVSTPSQSLPQIVGQSGKVNKRQLPTVDAHLKQQLKLSTPPRIIRTKKLPSSSDQNNPYAAVQAALKRLESMRALTMSFNDNSKTNRSVCLLAPNFITAQIQRTKSSELIRKSLSNGHHQMNQYSEQASLLTYSRKAHMHTRLPRATNETPSNSVYSFPQQSEQSFLPPIIYSSRWLAHGRSNKTHDFPRHSNLLFIVWILSYTAWKDCPMYFSTSRIEFVCFIAVMIPLETVMSMASVAFLIV